MSFVPGGRSARSRLAARRAEDEVQRQPWGPEWWLYVLLALTMLFGLVLLVRFLLAL